MSEPSRVEALLTPEAYLAWEESADVKHEYVGGHVYALAGASPAHIRIVANLTGLLWQHLAGHPCEVMGNDLKVRPAEDVIYYPDLTVVCDPDPQQDFTDRPRVIIEVSSPSTRRIDEAEKADAYWRLPSVEAYILVAQDVLWVRVLRRGPDGWETESLTRPDDLLRLDSLGFAAPLSAVYDRTGVLEE
ncbi:MAG: Uma2 family endonuclease [Armatimonadetes bacterium]|nr:Uma2 family endonuclease [Armatimonadota bacterium]